MAAERTWPENLGWLSTLCGTGEIAAGCWDGSRRRRSEPGSSGPTRRNWIVFAGFVPGTGAATINSAHRNSRRPDAPTRVSETERRKSRDIQAMRRQPAKGVNINKLRSMLGQFVRKTVRSVLQFSIGAGSEDR